MTKKQVRNFSAEEQTRRVLGLLKEDITLSHLSSKYEVSSNSILIGRRNFYRMQK